MSKNSASNGVAAICSLFIPGLGQLVQGRVGAGILFLLGTVIGLVVCLLPGICVWLWAVVDAAVYRGNL